MTSERKFVEENIRRVLLKEYLLKETGRAGFGGIDIQRTPMGTRVTLSIERPGIVIGRRGATIKKLTEAVEHDFHFDNPQIEVQEVKNPNLSAQISAHKLASALERGWHFRRAGHATVRRIMESGARGCQVVLSGKLTGRRHRVEKFKAGHIKFCGEPAIQWMDEGFAVAKKKLGVIGVKVQIMDPDAILPDETKVLSPAPPVDETEAESDATTESPSEGAEASQTEEPKPKRDFSRPLGIGNPPEEASAEPVKSAKTAPPSKAPPPEKKKAAPKKSPSEEDDKKGEEASAAPDTTEASKPSQTEKSTPAKEEGDDREQLSTDDGNVGEKKPSPTPDDEEESKEVKRDESS